MNSPALQRMHYLLAYLDLTSRAPSHDADYSASCNPASTMQNLTKGFDPNSGGTALAPRPSPTARRRRLAAALRQMREARRLSCADAGKAVGWSESKISRIETGRVRTRQPDLECLLNLYEVTGEERVALLTLGRQAAHRGWWHSYTDALPAWFEDYIGLEDGAKSLLTYQNQLVHGLMQTEEYAAAVIRAAQQIGRAHV